MVKSNSRNRTIELQQNIVFKVVQRYANKRAVSNYYGFGDIIRGILATYQYCKLHNHTMKIDIHEHPISSLISVNDQYCTEVAGPSYFHGGDGGPFSSLHLTKNSSIIFSNVFPNPLSEEDKEFLRSIITVNADYKISIPAPYNVFHIRTGDNMQRSSIVPAEFDIYISLIAYKCQPGDIVCSDSNLFKKYVKEKIPHVKVFNEDISGSHIGYETDMSVLRSTIEDYQILAGAAKIYTYSVYNWISGFVNWCAKANNIPIINLKPLRTGPNILRMRRITQYISPPLQVNKSNIQSTICVAWTQRVAPPYHQYTWGLGDALRGTLAAYQFCKANNCRFVVDIHRHPFSHFLEWTPSELHAQVEKATINLRGIGGSPIHKPPPGVTEFIYGNSFCRENLEEDEKALVRNILRVKSEYKMELPAEYNVIHIRVGDSQMGSNNTTNLHRYIKTIARVATDGDYLCCDSPALKRLCRKELPSIRVVNEDGYPSHFGTDTSLESLRVTLDDMQVIMNARKIYTYTVYPWISNFVQWISKGFDIPLEVIRLEPPIISTRRTALMLNRTTDHRR